MSKKAKAERFRVWPNKNGQTELLTTEVILKREIAGLTRLIHAREDCLNQLKANRRAMNDELLELQTLRFELKDRVQKIPEDPILKILRSKPSLIADLEAIVVKLGGFQASAAPFGQGRKIHKPGGTKNENKNDS